MSNVDEIVHFGQNCTIRQSGQFTTKSDNPDKIVHFGQIGHFCHNETVRTKLDNPNIYILVLLEKILKRYDKCT